MLTYLFRFVMRLLAGILVQQVLRFLANTITRPRRPAPEPRSGTPKKPRTTINPKDIVEGRYEDLPEN